MPLGMGLLLVVGVLIAGILLYNHRPEQMLHELGRNFDIDDITLVAQPDPYARLEMVLAEVEQRYETLWYQAQELIRGIADPRIAQGKQEHLNKLRGQKPDAKLCRELYDLLASLEKHLMYNKRYERECQRLAHAFDTLTNIDKRLQARRTQAA